MTPEKDEAPQLDGAKLMSFISEELPDEAFLQWIATFDPELAKKLREEIDVS